MQGRSLYRNLLLVPTVPFLIVLFALSDETDMDVISEAMERLIETFQSELVPASVQIVERLVCILLRYFCVSWLSLPSVAVPELLASGSRTCRYPGRRLRPR
jgi:hypothetical protein